MDLPWYTIVFPIVMTIGVALAVRRVRRADLELGAQAYRDGLPYNPAWGKNVCRGYHEEARNRKVW